MKINHLMLLLCCLLCKPLLAATITVKITDFIFTPKVVTINEGDTVTWINNGLVPHTTTSTTPSGLWSKTLTTGQSFSFTFTKAGTYAYNCVFHATMTATVVVRSPEQTRILTGKNLLTNIVPITLNLTGKNADLAYLGSYIVNAQSGCANCHSCPTYKVGNNPYLGQPKKFNSATYLAGGVNVTGGGISAVSTNITPDATGKPAGLTLVAFKNLLRTGHSPAAPSAFIPVMPWPIFGLMTDKDLNAIYEYLRAIPKAVTPAAQCTAPGN